MNITNPIKICVKYLQFTDNSMMSESNWPAHLIHSYIYIWQIQNVNSVPLSNPCFLKKQYTKFSVIKIYSCGCYSSQGCDSWYFFCLLNNLTMARSEENQLVYGKSGVKAHCGWMHFNSSRFPLKCQWNKKKTIRKKILVSTWGSQKGYIQSKSKQKPTNQTQNPCSSQIKWLGNWPYFPCSKTYIRMIYSLKFWD